MPNILEAACACNIGLIRKNNEDNFLFNNYFLEERNNGLEDILELSSDLSKPLSFGVFDGMGGELAGETASYIAAKIFSENETKNLSDICKIANDEVCSFSKEYGIKSMGSTVAVLRVTKEFLSFVNLGDTKIYHWDGSLKQVSVDHTDAELVQGLNIKRKPCLTQHLGIFPEDFVIEPYTDVTEAKSGDKFIICSDGLTDMVDINTIERIVKIEESPKACIKSLMNLALRNGGRDNITIISLFLY